MVAVLGAICRSDSREHSGRSPGRSTPATLPPPPHGLCFSAGFVPASPRTVRPAVTPSVVGFSGFTRIKEVNGYCERRNRPDELLGDRAYDARAFA